MDAAKTTGQKFLETVQTEAGKLAWEKAKGLWDKIAERTGQDPKVKGAAMMVSADPEDASSQEMLARVLSIRLKDDPMLAQDLLKLLGGPDAIQEVTADRISWVENITQEMEGTGKQTVRASDGSIIRGVTQIKK
jgi:hypothetical protein